MKSRPTSVIERTGAGEFGVLGLIFGGGYMGHVIYPTIVQYY